MPDARLRRTREAYRDAPKPSQIIGSPVLMPLCDPHHWRYIAYLHTFECSSCGRFSGAQNLYDGEA